MSEAGVGQDCKKFLFLLDIFRQVHPGMLSILVNAYIWSTNGWVPEGTSGNGNEFGVVSESVVNRGAAGWTEVKVDEKAFITCSGVDSVFSTSSDILSVKPGLCSEDCARPFLAGKAVTKGVTDHGPINLGPEISARTRCLTHKASSDLV